MARPIRYSSKPTPARAARWWSYPLRSNPGAPSGRGQDLSVYAATVGIHVVGVVGLGFCGAVCE